MTEQSIKIDWPKVLKHIRDENGQLEYRPDYTRTAGTVCLTLHMVGSTRALRILPSTDMLHSRPARQSNWFGVYTELRIVPTQDASLYTGCVRTVRPSAPRCSAPALACEIRFGRDVSCHQQPVQVLFHARSSGYHHLGLTGVHLTLFSRCQHMLRHLSPLCLF